MLQDWRMRGGKNDRAVAMKTDGQDGSYGHSSFHLFLHLIQIFCLLFRSTKGGFSMYPTAKILKFATLPLISAIFIDIYYQSLRMVGASVGYLLKPPSVDLNRRQNIWIKCKKRCILLCPYDPSCPSVFMATSMNWLAPDQRSNLQNVVPRAPPRIHCPTINMLSNKNVWGKYNSVLKKSDQHSVLSENKISSINSCVLVRGPGRGVQNEHAGGHSSSTPQVKVHRAKPLLRQTGYPADISRRILE